MEPSRISSYYLMACDRVHQVVDELYESLHNEKGEPIKDLESVVDFVTASRKQIYEELDLIKSIVSEYESSQSGDHKRDDSSG